MTDRQNSSGDKPDPSKSAQAGLTRALPKRFYREVGIEERDGAFALLLDGRAAKTPAKAVLAVPSRALAEAMAEEWQAQAGHVDPASMPVTRIVRAALDGISRQREKVVADIVRHAGFDLLCYRARHPENLVRRQQEGWDPILRWAAQALGAPLQIGAGIEHIEQPAEAFAAIQAATLRLDAIQLAALHAMATLTGSAVLALAVLHGALEPEAAWAAAHIDEDYQIEIWGLDAEARQRRAARWLEMDAAARILACHPMVKA